MTIPQEKAEVIPLRRWIRIDMWHKAMESRGRVTPATLGDLRSEVVASLCWGRRLEISDDLQLDGCFRGYPHDTVQAYVDELLKSLPCREAREEVSSAVADDTTRARDAGRSIHDPR